MKRTPAVLYVVPFVLAAVPALFYLAAPEFYLRVVLNDQMREYQAVEMVTFGAALLGGVLLAIGARRLWKVRPGPDYGPQGLRGVPDRLGAFALVAGSALAGVFFAGEEVNWGQTFLHWGVGERMQERDITLNLHNTTDLISIQSFGSIYVLATFVAVPLIWAFRERLNLPDAWRAAIPVLPATLAVLLGLSLSELKDVYAALTPDYKNDAHYIAFFEQLNEQKEMMIGVALMLFGVGVLLRTSATAPEPQADTES